MSSVIASTCDFSAANNPPYLLEQPLIDKKLCMYGGADTQFFCDPALSNTTNVLYSLPQVELRDAMTEGLPWVWVFVALSGTISLLSCCLSTCIRCIQVADDDEVIELDSPNPEVVTI